MTEEAPRETTPPPLQPIQAPSAKERKYDRQLRLWAASGQRALEESHVLLVVGNTAGSNTSVAGAETLKNLILPSIGHFTIADSAKVTEADLGVNFFLEESSLAKSRAEETTSFLQELNPDVQGHSIKDPLHDWLPKQDSLKPYNLILVCAPLPQAELDRLSFYALDQSIPLVYIRSQGFFSTSSIQLPAEFPIVDTHPDPETVQDLRLLKPWDELQAAEKELGDLSQMTDHDHGHVPWLLLLLRYLQHWKQQHGGQYPSNFKEKTEFRSFVRDQARTSNAEGGEENFDEACAAVLKSISPPTLGSGCREMFNIDSCTHLTQASANFWLVANAIKQFYDKHEVLPLPGGLPDMKATSAGYIKLQTIYKAKARADIAEVTDTVRKLESSLGRPEQIAGSEIEQFCKNAAFVRVLTNHGKQPLPELRLLKGDEKTLTKLPAMLTSFQSISEVFLAMNIDFIPSSTLSELKALEDMIEGGTLEERIDKAIEEVTRTLGHEMHNTSSITGGMVAQEAIKLLTRQYVPVDGVVIWDGIRSRTEIVKI
ncbi:hypothetical protein LTR70_008368 [Exophiala xenobiotica]|nr:hypothetical protein LTR70_008368 [Exophiala xenobiotica]